MSQVDRVQIAAPKDPDVVGERADDLPDPRTTRDVAREHLSTLSPHIDREIAEVVEEEVADRWLRDAISYHFGWLDEHFRPLATDASRRAGGKKLRATLAVLSYRAAAPDSSGHGAGSRGIERVAPFAAAIELVHNWSLVHDDILDGDRTRRGRPALWVICGQGQAINVGDCMHALAFRCLDRLRDRGISNRLVVELLLGLARTAAGMVTGQVRDVALERATDIDRDRYLEMVEGKTAGLMRCAAFGGALLGAPSEAAALPFAELGRELGISFQIRDDILGIWGTSEETGKPTGTDIRRRKKSLPVVLAFELAGTADRERLRRLYHPNDEPMTATEETCVRQILDRCGAQRRARELGREHRLRALAALSSADEGAAGPPPAPTSPTTTTSDRSPPPRQQRTAALRALTDLVTDHTY